MRRRSSTPPASSSRERWAKVIALTRKRIVEMCRCEGKAVKAGDVLARLDDSQERSLLAELEARRKRLQSDVEPHKRARAAQHRAADAARTDRDAIARVRGAHRPCEGADRRAHPARAAWTAWCCAATAKSARSPARERATSCSGSASRRRCASSPTSTRRTSRACASASACCCARGLPRPDARRQRRGNHAQGRSADEDVPRLSRPARRYAAAHRHERRGQHRDAARRRTCFCCPPRRFSRARSSRSPTGALKRVRVETGIRGSRMVEITGGVSEGDAGRLARHDADARRPARAR